MADADLTAQRKKDHVRINLEEDVQSRLTTGFERLRFVHTALPELDLEAVDTTTTLLGRTCASPILISSMTGGAEGLEDINRRLARAAQSRRIAMGVGSQRAALESEALATSFRIRGEAPDALLFANLGAVQLNYGYGVDACRRAVDMIEADALILHLNPLQEALQPEGDGRWSDLLSKVETVAAALEVPLIAKEVGWGISGRDARRLWSAGVSVIDVAGAGGTSWSEVEKHRAPTAARRHVAGLFVDWGLPTAESLRAVREAVPEVELIASGGIKHGVDVAKGVALGARLCGLAGPFLRAAQSSEEAVAAQIDQLTDALRVAMFATGSADLEALRAPGVLRPVDTVSGVEARP